MTGSNALLVLGMHRSGTSATSGALAHFGFDLGQRLVAPADDNPKGYFEHEPVVAIHEAFLESVGRRWCDPSGMPPDIWGGEPAAAARRAIVEAVAQDFRASPRWALKDPRLSRLLPLWTPLWPDLGVVPSAVVVVRRPVEVAASLARRDGFPTLLSDLLWIRHTLEALRGTLGMARTCIEYSRLVADPVATLSTALDRLGLAEGLPAPPGLVGFVDASMNHHALARRDRDDAVADLADELFAACSRHADGPGEDALAAFEQRFLDVRLALEPTLEAGVAAFRPAVAEAARWRDDVFATKSALNAQVRWSDEAAAELQRVRHEASTDLERLRHEAAEARLALEEEGRVLSALQRDFALVESLVRAREAERDELASQRERLRRDLDLVLASRSWRWTSPLRRLAGFLTRTSR